MRPAGGRTAGAVTTAAALPANAPAKRLILGALGLTPRRAPAAGNPGASGGKGPAPPS